jgi:cysteine desulfurase
MPPPIYLDNNSTTPVDPEVLEAMLPYFTTRFGNPSNTLHTYGTQAADAVEWARGQVAAILGATSQEVVFTSGATESNNLAILGTCRFGKSRYDHVVTCATEHKAVLEPCRQLEREGFRVSYLPVDRFGMVAAEDIERCLTPTTLLVSVMAANNEIGTIQPMKEIGAVCQKHHVLFHTDAVQAVGKIPVDVNEWNVDLLGVSAHKLYGPKGVGALYVRKNGARLGLVPLLFGGGQESGLRSGTLPVPQIVGFGVACKIARERLNDEPDRIRSIRNELRDILHAGMPQAVTHGHPDQQLPGLLNLGFPDVEGDVFIQLLTGVAASQGSSCSAGSFEPSHVLRAIGVSDELARASLRLGVGRFNTAEEIKRAAELIIVAAKQSRLAAQHERIA